MTNKLNDPLNTIGTILETEEPRDCIHVAVMAVTASQKLHPGQDANQNGGTENPIGIVDPFLRDPVYKGDIFWLFIYPRSIKGIRHHWEHDSITEKHDSITEESESSLIFQPTRVVCLNESEKWIRQWAFENEISYDNLMEAANYFLEYDEYWCEGSRFEGTYLPEDFWYHYEKVKNIKVPMNKKYSFFSCSC